MVAAVHWLPEVLKVATMAALTWLQQPRFWQPSVPVIGLRRFEFLWPSGWRSPLPVSCNWHQVWRTDQVGTVVVASDEASYTMVSSGPVWEALYLPLVETG